MHVPLHVYNRWASGGSGMRFRSATLIAFCCGVVCASLLLGLAHSVQQLMTGAASSSRLSVMRSSAAPLTYPLLWYAPFW